jgi:hypothetical protein
MRPIMMPRVAMPILPILVVGGVSFLLAACGEETSEEQIGDPNAANTTPEDKDPCHDLEAEALVSCQTMRQLPRRFLLSIGSESMAVKPSEAPVMASGFLSCEDLQVSADQFQYICKWSNPSETLSLHGVDEAALSQARAALSLRQSGTSICDFGGYGVVTSPAGEYTAGNQTLCEAGLIYLFTGSLTASSVVGTLANIRADGDGVTNELIVALYRGKAMPTEEGRAINGVPHLDPASGQINNEHLLRMASPTLTFSVVDQTITGEQNLCGPCDDHQGNQVAEQADISARQSESDDVGSVDEES